MKKIFFFLACLSTLTLLPTDVMHAQSDEMIGGIRKLMVNYQTGNYQGILTESETMLGLAEKEFGKEDPLYAMVLSLVASAQGEMGKLEEAENNFRIAINGLKNAPPDLQPFAGRAYAGLGNVANAKGDTDQSISYYAKAISIFDKTVGRQGPDYANAVNALGNLYKDLGEYGKAETHLKEAADIRKVVYGETHEIYGVSLNNLGSLKEQMGDYRGAALDYEKSREIWSATLGHNHPLIATAFNNYAGLFVKVGNYGDAIKFYEKALAISESVYGPKHEQYLSTLSNIGNVYGHARNFDKALEYGMKALTMRKEVNGTKSIEYAYSLNNVGLALMNMKRFAEAEKHLQEALTIFTQAMGKNHKSVAVCSNNLGMLHVAMKSPDKASGYLRQSLAINLDRIDKVFPVINEKEKALFTSTIEPDFEFFNYFTSLNHKNNATLTADCYNYTIATKALLLNTSNKIKRRILNSGDQELISKYNEWKVKKNRLAQVWQMSIEEKTRAGINEQSLETEILNLEKELSSRSEIFATQSDRTRYTWKDIQKKLKPDEAAIEIIRFRKFNFEFTDTVHYAALIIKPSSTAPEFVYLRDGNHLEKRLLTYYKNAIHKQYPDDKSYDGYWAPIQARLSGIKKVYLSPDGVYNQISLNSLYNPATQRFLMDETEVQQVTNTKDLLALPKKQNLRNAIMIGYPDYKTLPPDQAYEEEIPEISDSSKREVFGMITSLPGTLSEVATISSIFKSTSVETQVVTGSGASEGFVKKAKSPSVLHIATHGFFLPDVQSKNDDVKKGFFGFDPAKVEENPLLRSGILLAGAQRTTQGNRPRGEDGILSAYEATSLDLDETELVVLSACETGLGEIRNGEGVYGFQRALIIAGAKSVIMSLWKVSDEATQELMSEFYKYWMQGNSKRKAFLMAQQAIRTKHPQPYFWAPFILVGE